jgi:hypothetical protein
LNRDLKEIEKWDKEEIEKRALSITERFLKIWEIPDIQIEIESTNDEINIFDAESPKDKQLEFAIFFNQKLEIKQVAKLYAEIFRQLFDLQPETFFSCELGARLALTNSPTDDSPRQKIWISDKYCIEGNMDSQSKFERIKIALTIFGFEDELFIKYAE